MERPVEVLLLGREFKQLLEGRIAKIRELYGLRRIDVEILFYLYRFGAQNTPRDIQKAYKLTKGHISQSVERLVRMNFLEIVPDKKDRRCVHFVLTPQAEEIACSVGKMWEDMTAVIFEGITEQERQALYEVAVKMTRNMETAIAAAHKAKEADANEV